MDGERERDTDTHTQIDKCINIYICRERENERDWQTGRQKRRLNSMHPTLYYIIISNYLSSCTGNMECCSSATFS